MKSTSANKSITPKKVAKAIASSAEVMLKKVTVSVRRANREHFFAIIDGIEFNMTKRGFNMVDKSSAKQSSDFGYDYTTVTYSF